MTLDGLPTKKDRKMPSGKPCGNLKEVHLGVIDQVVRVCERDLEGISSAPQLRTKRGRGRPKGTTVKSGAKPPRVTACTTPHTVTRKDGRRICKCSDKGNSRILANAKCGL